MFWKSGLLLVEVNREQFEPDRRSTLKVQKQRKKRVAIFAAAQANHHAITIFDHFEIADSGPHSAQQPLPESSVFVLILVSH